MKKTIRLTESELHTLISEAVNRILKENIDGLDQQSNGFLDCVKHLNMQVGGNNSQRVIDGNVLNPNRYMTAY